MINAASFLFFSVILWPPNIMITLSFFQLLINYSSVIRSKHRTQICNGARLHFYNSDLVMMTFGVV